MPDAEDPQPPASEDHDHKATAPTALEEEEYHEHADRYMERLNEAAEGLQETRQDVEVDYSVGLSILQSLTQHLTNV